MNLSLGPQEQYQQDVRQIFGFSPDRSIVGSLIVESSISGVVGDVSFGDPSAGNRFRSSLPLDTAPSRFAAFAHVANTGGFFTGSAIFNPNNQSANVEVKVYRADGTLTGSAKFVVPSNGRISKLLTEIVAASAGQGGGYFTVESDQPVSSIALFGTTSLSALSAIPAQGRVP